MMYVIAARLRTFFFFCEERGAVGDTYVYAMVRRCVSICAPAYAAFFLVLTRCPFVSLIRLLLSSGHVVRERNDMALGCLI